jgi:hypothetical protein
MVRTDPRRVWIRVRGATVLTSPSDNRLGVTPRTLRVLATQPLKEIAWERRGNPFVNRRDVI